MTDERDRAFDSIFLTGALGLPQLQAHRVRVLLVDDEASIGEAVRRMLSADASIEFQYCTDPSRAIETANAFEPTVILQDLEMSEVDGLTMLRFFRANPATSDVPMIVLSTKEDPKGQARAFARGAQDYLVKPPDPIELIARIRHHSRGYIALLERNDAYKALEISTLRLVEELAKAARFVRSLLPDPLTGEIGTDWRFLPSVQLGGDAFGYHWIDPDHFAIYLLDVCGHGVESALLSVSAMNVVRNRTLPSTDFCQPAQVITRMNDAFQMDRQNGLYFTMWYGVFDRQTRQLAFSSAGHPPAVIVTETSDEPIVLMKPGLMVGGIAGTTFDADVVDVPPHSRLYVFSDGVYEITKPDNVMVTFEEFLQILAEHKGSDPSRLDGIITTLRQLRGSDQFEDDVSIVEVTF